MVKNVWISLESMLIDLQMEQMFHHDFQNYTVFSDYSI